MFFKIADDLRAQRHLFVQEAAVGELEEKALPLEARLQPLFLVAGARHPTARVAAALARRLLELAVHALAETAHANHAATDDAAAAAASANRSAHTRRQNERVDIGQLGDEIFVRPIGSAQFSATYFAAN